MAIGLSVGYEPWPPIGWHHAFVIGLSRYRLGLPSAPLHYGITWPVGIPTVFQTPLTVLCTAITLGGHCLPLGMCRGTVKESRATGRFLCLPGWRYVSAPWVDLWPLITSQLTCLIQGPAWLKPCLIRSEPDPAHQSLVYNHMGTLYPRGGRQIVGRNLALISVIKWETIDLISIEKIFTFSHLVIS